MANIYSYIHSLPNKLDTAIGGINDGLSGGQKQRLLIARALYKNPEVLFFEEATSSLDTENEATIMANLTKFSKNRTMIIAAHRLSTIVDADLIYVFDRGRIAEVGTHHELLSNRNQYFELFNNQLNNMSLNFNSL